MTATPPPVLDDETLRMARQVFQWVRAGDLASLQPLLDQGLPPNLRNEHGDSLLMLAAYHGHAELAAALLRAGWARWRQRRGWTPEVQQRRQEVSNRYPRAARP